MQLIENFNDLMLLAQALDLDYEEVHNKNVLLVWSDYDDNSDKNSMPLYLEFAVQNPDFYYEYDEKDNFYIVGLDKGAVDKVVRELSSFPAIKESYTKENEQEYIVWSSSDLLDKDKRLPLVKIIVDENGDLVAEAIDDKEINKEAEDIANSVIKTAKRANKSVDYTLDRIDRTLNHNDPFFSVEFDRSITNSGLELLAAQVLRTLKDDLKNFVNNAIANKAPITEEDVVNKFKTLTGVDYYTGEVIDEDFVVELPVLQYLGKWEDDEDREEKDKKDEKGKPWRATTKETINGKDQYNQILGLMLKDPDDKYNYIPPKENQYIQQLRKLTDDLIEKVILKGDPNFFSA